jgi:hypothetical protein
MALREQLVTWFPSTKGKTDTVMALWFAEIRARELCMENEFINFYPNKYLSERKKEDQIVVDLDLYAARGFYER